MGAATMPAEGEAVPAEVADPVASARAAGLRYVSDALPGIRRLRAGKGFSYRGLDGRPVRDPQTLARIRALAIPPAYSDVWIAPDPRGHLQATGRDAKGRKQYRYHPHWRATRDETKYDRMVAFGRALPALRAQLARDLARPGLPRERVLALVVELLERTLIRVGNQEYARANASYGLTTLRNKHVAVDGGAVRFTFRGKSGVAHAVTLKDRRLARIVRRLRDLPGYELFQYLDDDDQRQAVDSADVNDYLRAITGEGFTAKDFRTWGGSVLCLLSLRDCGPFDSEAQAKRNVVEAVKRVAARLGNTPAVCRKAYIHPTIIATYLDRTLLDRADRPTEGGTGLEPAEEALMGVLRTE